MGAGAARGRHSKEKNVTGKLITKYIFKHIQEGV